MTEFQLHIFTGRRENLLGSKKLVHRSQDGRTEFTSGLRAHPHDTGLKLIAASVRSGKIGLTENSIWFRVAKAQPAFLTIRLSRHELDENASTALY